MRRVALGLVAISLIIIIAVGVLLVTQSGEDTGDLEEMSMEGLIEDIENSEVVLVTARGEYLKVSYEMNEDPTHFVDTGEEVTNLPQYLEDQGVNPAALSDGPALAYEGFDDSTNYLETYGLAIAGVVAVMLVLGIIVFIRSDESPEDAAIQ